MSKVLKSLMRDQLKDRFADLDGGVFISTQGLDSEKTYAFRAALHAKNVKYTVLRNSLAKAAFEAYGYKGAELAKVLKGCVGVAYAREEGSATTAARAVAEWKKDNKDKVIQWVGALIEGQVLNAADAEALKDAPTKDQARAMLLGIWQAPVTQFLGTARETYARVVYALNAFADKRKDSGEAA